MASINEIKALLRKALGTRVTEKELDTLAATISAKSETSAKAGGSQELLEGQIALNKELGRTKEALEALLALRSEEAAQQAEIASQLDDNGDLDKEQIDLLKQKESAYKEVQQELDNLNRQKEESAELDRALGSLAQNVALSYYNMADAGVTTQAVFGKIKSGASSVGKSLKEIAKSNNKLAASMQAAGGAMKSVFNSEMAQSVRKQGDVLNQVTMQAQRWSDISKTLQTQNQQIYQQTGLLTKDNMQLASSLSEIADSTKSLQLADESLVAAKIELQNQFAFFNKESIQSQTEILKTTALLEKAGVSAGTTAENYDFFRKSLGLSSAEAAENSRKLLDVARNLGQSPEKIAQSFSQGRKYISRFGRDYMKTFTKMVGVSGKLGIEVDKLLGSLDSMETISGAAEAAGRLSSLLKVNIKGGAANLLTGDYESKLRTIADAFQRTEVDLTDARNRGALRQTAEQLALDESEILKIYRAAKEGTIEKTINNMAKVQDKSTTTAAELDKQNRKAMTADQLAKKELEKGQLGMVKAMGKLQTVMAENVMLIKGLAAAFSAATTIGTAVSAGKSALDRFRQARKSGMSPGKALLSAGASGISSAANTAGALRVFVVNADEFPSGGGMGGDDFGLDDLDGPEPALENCSGLKGKAKKRCKKRRRRQKKKRDKRRKKNKKSRSKSSRRSKKPRSKIRGGGKGRGIGRLLTGLGSTTSLMGDMGGVTSLVDNVSFGKGGSTPPQEIGKKAAKKKVTKDVAKATSQSAAKGLGVRGAMMGAGKFAGKLIPGVGAGLFAYDAQRRWTGGDKLGASLAAVGGVASLVPGIGTAIAGGIEAINLSRDALEAYRPEWLDKADSFTRSIPVLGSLYSGVMGLFGDDKKKSRRKKSYKVPTGLPPSKDPAHSAARSDWKSKSKTEKQSYCDKNTNPPYGVDPFACGDLNLARRKQFDKLVSEGGSDDKIRALGKGMGMSDIKIGKAIRQSWSNKEARTKKQKNDFRGISGAGFKNEINANSSDQLLGVKEGGLIDRKLERLIVAMTKLAERKRVSLNIDKKQLAKVNLAAINDNIYRS